MCTIKKQKKLNSCFRAICAIAGFYTFLLWKPLAMAFEPCAESGFTCHWPRVFLPWGQSSYLALFEIPLFFRVFSIALLRFRFGSWLSAQKPGSQSTVCLKVDVLLWQHNRLLSGMNLVIWAALHRHGMGGGGDIVTLPPRHAWLTE